MFVAFMIARAQNKMRNLEKLPIVEHIVKYLMKIIEYLNIIGRKQITKDFNLHRNNCSLEKKTQTLVNRFISQIYIFLQINYMNEILFAVIVKQMYYMYKFALVSDELANAHSC